MGESEQERILKCPACGQDVATSEDGLVAEHATPGGSTCPASGWTIKGVRQ